MKGLVTIILAVAAVAAIGSVTSAFKLPIPGFSDIFAYTYKYDDGGKYTAGDTTINAGVKNLNIDWVTGNGTVEYHDDETVLVKETSNRSLNDDTRLHLYLDGDTLYIKYAKNGARIKSDMQKDLVITLPRSVKTGLAEIDNTTGDIFVKGGTWQELDLKATTGSVNVSANMADKLNAKSTTGNVNADIQSAGAIDLHCTTGDIIIFAGSFESINAKVTTGNIRASLPEKPGFTAKLSTVTGDVSCALPHTDSDKQYVIGDGSRPIEMKAVTGDIKITG